MANTVNATPNVMPDTVVLLKLLLAKALKITVAPKTNTEVAPPQKCTAKSTQAIIGIARSNWTLMPDNFQKSSPKIFPPIPGIKNKAGDTSKRTMLATCNHEMNKTVLTTNAPTEARVNMPCKINGKLLPLRPSFPPLSQMFSSNLRCPKFQPLGLMGKEAAFLNPLFIRSIA